MLLNFNLCTTTLEEDAFEQSSSPRPQPKRTPEPQSEPEPMDIPDEAQREKELGNAAYKKNILRLLSSIIQRQWIWMMRTSFT